MNSFRVQRDFAFARFVAAFVGLVLLFASAYAAGLRIVNRSFPGIYFGSFAGSAGTFALYIREDNTGALLGYLPGSGIGVAHSTVTVDDAGRFAFLAGQGAMAPSISGIIAADGTVA